VQDQWSIRRFTINACLRVDYFNAYVPAQTIPAGPWVPERRFDAVRGVPSWTDINPRLGVAYDLFGDSRTALNFSLGRYLGVTGVDIATANNPMFASVWNVNRSWADTNGNYLPDCDLNARGASGECGPMADQNFGAPRATTRWSDDVFRGAGLRDDIWDVTTEVQHQITPAISVKSDWRRRSASGLGSRTSSARR